MYDLSAGLTVTKSETMAYKSLKLKTNIKI